jgi:hypothetical protein
MNTVKQNPAKQVVYGHVNFFAEKDGKLTWDSIESGHHCQRITSGVSLKTRAIENMMGDNPHTVDTITKLENPASTGIWNKDGTFNQDVFNQLTKNYINRGDGKQIITKQMFWDHLNERHQKKDFGNACHVFYVIPVPWTKVTEGSIDELFKYYADTTHSNEPAFTIERLYEFYTNPTKCMSQLVQKELLSGKC